MREVVDHFRGRPLLFLFGFVGTWVVARTALVPVAALDTRHLVEPYRLFDAERARGSSVSLATGVTAVVSPAVERVDQVRDKRAVFPFVAHKGEVQSVAKQPLHGKSFPKAAHQSPPFILSKSDGGAQTLAAVAPQRQPVIAARIEPLPRESDRWSGSAWLLWRQGSNIAPSGNVSPRYGASQAGMRLAYRLDQASSLEVYGRATAALQSKGKDIAIGAAIKPLRKMNVAVAAEYRFALDGATKSGPALMSYGGFGPTSVGKGWTAEGYGQAGVVGVKSPIPFADGSVRVKREVARVSEVPIAIGAGGWAGTDNETSRLDIGPMLDADLKPVTGVPLRASLDWRQRVAGSALPDSGVAFTLVTDF